MSLAVAEVIPAGINPAARQNSSWPRRCAVVLWIVLGFALTARTAYRPANHTVFPLFAAGSAHWWADQPLYANYRPLDYFRYPPLFAIVFTPLATLGTVAGGILWGWLNLAVYFLGLHRLVRDVLPGRWTPGREAAFLILAGVGGVAGLWNGQSNPLIVGLLLLAVSALVRERWWSAAVLLAMTVGLKFMPLPFALLFCALWTRRLAGRFLLAVAFGFLLPFLTRPASIVCEQYRGWANHLVLMSGERWPGFRDGWTVWVVTRHALEGRTGMPDLLQPIEGVWYRGLQVLGGLAVLVGCLWFRRRASSRGVLITVVLALGAAWSMLLGPAVEAPTYVFLAPLLAWAVVQSKAWPAGRRLIEASAVLILVLSWRELTYPFWEAVPWLVLTLPLGSALFLLWILGYCRWSTRRANCGCPLLALP
jgi:hypothetical protein